MKYYLLFSFLAIMVCSRAHAQVEKTYSALTVWVVSRKVFGGYGRDGGNEVPGSEGCGCGEDLGKAANVAAWAVLAAGGRAVEKGVMVPEADPNNYKIGEQGLNGRPCSLYLILIAFVKQI
jgi:hypothetical protein